ncbi:hypothetical protein [Bdellovibrio sp. HCB2-146]|uniref:hypothetical protein n=1 Tax=Bdellovibrio sp. HCB2-146 TaxID=3394362 RepID=UPI0039BD8543
MSTLKYAFAIGSAFTILTACQPEVEEQSSSSRYLYVATGACNNGFGITTYTGTNASNVIFRLNAESGQYEGRIADFSTVADAPATPVSVTDFDDDYLLALIEHGTLRRVEKIEKKLSGERTTFYNNTSATAPIGALTGVLKSIIKVSDGYLISKTTAIEKLNTSLTRVPGTGTASWVATPGGVCATANINFNSLTTYPTTGNASGYNIVYTHSAGASNATTNRIGVINGLTGWNGTTGCVSNQSTVAAAATPVAAVYMKNHHRLVVAYAGTNTTPQNSLYTYAIDEAATSNVISDAFKGYDDPNVIFAASAMYYDEETSSLYVAGGAAIATNLTTGNTVYKIEKFTYDATTKLFTRVGSLPFYAGNIETRCISSMFVGN